MAKTDHAAELKTLRTALSSTQSDFEALGNDIKVTDPGNGERIKVEIDPKHRDASQKYVQDMKDLHLAIEVHEAALQGKAYLARPEGGSVAGLEAAREALGRAQTSTKSLGMLFLESDGYQEAKAAKFARGQAWSAEVQSSLRRMPVGSKANALAAQYGQMTDEQKDIYTATGGQFTRPGFGAGLDIVEAQMYQQRVRDLFPVDTTTENHIDFLRESGFTNNAAPVGERANLNSTTGVETPVAPLTVGGNVFAMKPSSDITFTQDNAAVRTIAHWIRAHKSVLADEPRLRSIIDTRMVYGLKLEEDAQILLGDGTGENLNGILPHQGIQHYNGLATDRKSIQIRRALTRVYLALFQPTGLVLHDFDWEDIETEKDAQGRLVVTMDIVEGAQTRLWRTPLVTSHAMPQGQYLTGAFGLAAKVWDREQANVSISTEDGDNYRRNAVTILAEERIALEVTRPEAFVTGNFATPNAGV